MSGNPEYKYLGPPDYEIHKEEGFIYGAPTRAPQFTLIVDDSEGKAKMFKRNMKHSSGRAERWLVAECNGVRLYCVSLGMFVLTSKDVYSDKALVDKLAAGEFADIP